ncbi:MAG: carbon starvation protein A [Planctomycetota bacterium]|nr:carbon starvation protein A [Planctomycetota bacterium]
MNAITIAIFALSAFSLAYRFYAKYLAQRVFGSEDDGAEAFETPAHVQRDDVDFVPTNKHILFGHHFTSISGAGPIVGPAIAVIWGWLPAVLWIVFGAVFIGAVHDFGCLVVSAKSKGRSMAEITGEEVGGRARFLFLILILFLTWIVLAVFAFVIASLFVDYPASVIPINFEILVAMLLGYGVYKKGLSITWPSIAALVALYVMVFVGVQAPITTHTLFLDQAQIQRIEGFQTEQHAAAVADPEVKAIDFTKVKVILTYLKERDPKSKNDEIQALRLSLSKARGKAIKLWMYLLLSYSFVACCLPVWLLLQPRDYINSHQLMVGLGGLYLGLAILNPPVVAPAIEAAPPGAPNWFPFIFVTIACGAISGFHGLVSSGTTSKQLDKLPDARPIGYGSMLGEATLGLIVTLACVAGFKSADAWQAHYVSWSAAKSLDSKLDAFLSGGSWFLSSLGIPVPVGMVIIAVIVISFAATTLDSAARVQRFVLGELGERVGGRAGSLLKNVWFASLLACLSPVLLLDAKTAEGKPLWTEIWPIFGSANQLLGALCLLVLTIWLARRGKNFWLTLIPFAFIAFVTAYAFVLKLIYFYSECAKNEFASGKLVLGVTILLFGLGCWIFVESLLILRKGKLNKLENAA